MLLMVNMLGYFLGHYPDTFALTDSQRTLILQTMGFFIWLAGGAAIYAKLEQNSGIGWSFADAVSDLVVGVKTSTYLKPSFLRNMQANFGSYISVM